MSTSWTDEDVLPIYSRRPPSKARELVEQNVVLSRSEGPPWATLRVRSHSSTEPPLFYEGDPITGTVNLQLPDSGDTFNKVVLSLYGKIESSRSGTCTFLRSSKTLYCGEETTPKRPFLSKILHPARTVYGSVSWPFDFTLPSNVEFKHPSAKNKLTARLPPSFMETNALYRIRYQIVLRLRRSRFKFDSIFKTNIVYLPTEPCPLLPGPVAQISSIPRVPEVWHSFAPVTLGGRLFERRDVKVQYTLSLVQSPVYARGTSIYLKLQISSDDTQALDHLCAISSLPTIGLLRHARDPDGRPNDIPHLHNRSVAQATGWHQQAEPDTSSPALAAELKLPDDLAPSAEFGPYRIAYVIVMYPPAVGGFAPTKSTWLLSERVKIVVDSAFQGAPPMYADPFEQ